MTQLQTVFGFFDTIAEAQQAVQHLLAMGFTAENVALSTASGLNPTVTGDGPPPPIKADDSSGRFSASLFGSLTESQSTSGTLVTVQTLSATEARQVADLLDTAGAGKLAVDECLDVGLGTVTHSTN